MTFPKPHSWATAEPAPELVSYPTSRAASSEQAASSVAEHTQSSAHKTQKPVPSPPPPKATQKLTEGPAVGESLKSPFRPS